MDKVTVSAKIERAVREVFEKRYQGRSMAYEQARELLWLERELIENVIFEATRE